MTPFSKDLLRIYEFICDTYIHATCYFLGHKFGPWRAARGSSNSPIGALRECHRCHDYDYDSQIHNVNLEEK